MTAAGGSTADRRYLAKVDRRRWLWAALGAYALIGVVLTMVPINLLDKEAGGWSWDRPVNLVMFMPPVASVLLLDRRIRPWWPVLAVAVLSALIEAVQKLSPRDSSLQDWVLNVAGASLAAAAVAVGRLRRARP